MSKLNKDNLKTLWNFRELTVTDFIEKIKSHPDLKFLLTMVGMWFLLRWMLGLFIGVHLIFLLYRIFHLVLG